MSSLLSNLTENEILLLPDPSLHLHFRRTSCKIFYQICRLTKPDELEGGTMFSDSHRTRTVQRQVLYNQVWAQPMTKVAPEYGISNVALAKICKKFNIPYPWRGYWRRKETGKAVKLFPLPQNLEPAKQAATI